MSVDFVYDWIKIIGVTVPPLCVEVFLKDGNRYYLHSVGNINEKNGSLVLRIWDFRAFSPEDIEELKVRLNDIQSLDNETAIHPKLDLKLLSILNWIGRIYVCILTILHIVLNGMIDCGRKQRGQILVLSKMTKQQYV
jgi:hypothetical protein